MLTGVVFLAFDMGFDASAAVSGWNGLSTFEFPAGPVSVVVSDASTGGGNRLVEADATPS